MVVSRANHSTQSESVRFESSFYRGFFLVQLVLALLAWGNLAWGAETIEVDGARLVHLVRQDCGACHGLTLGGGLGPPLTPSALADKPAESLVATVIHGRRGTPMPPFAPFLSEGEARWIVDHLKTGFPEDRGRP